VSRAAPVISEASGEEQNSPGTSGCATRAGEWFRIDPVTDHLDLTIKFLANRSESLAKRSATQRMHKQAINNWKPSDLPVWLTREVYVKRVQAALASVAKSRIRSALGVSEPYSSDIQAGKRVPHPRHWQALAQLVGVSSNV